MAKQLPKFYQRFTAFQPIGEEKTYEMVRDKPAVPMALDLTRVEVDYPRIHKRFFGRPYPEETLRHHAIAEEVLAELSHVVDDTYHAGACCGPQLLAIA